jgi:hypothetical protein
MTEPPRIATLTANNKKPGDITLRPSYVYDADAGTVLTDTAPA